MVVAVSVVLVVQMPIDQIVDMVAMRHGRVTTTRTMNMLRAVARAFMASRARSRVLCRNLQNMLLDSATRGRMVQVSIVQVVDVSIVLKGRVSAVFAVDMIMIFVFVRHLQASPGSSKGGQKLHSV
jgi:hypothetical protein